MGEGVVLLNPIDPISLQETALAYLGPGDHELGQQAPSNQHMRTDTLLCPKGSSSGILLAQLLKLREGKARVQRRNVTTPKDTEPGRDTANPRIQAPDSLVAESLGRLSLGGGMREIVSMECFTVCQALC